MKFKIEEGTEITFIAVEWDAPHWEFDHPTIVLEPCIQYSPNGESGEELIESLAIDMCMEEELENEDIEAELARHGWSLPELYKIAEDKLSGKRNKKWDARVTQQTARFFLDEDGDLQFNIIKSLKC